MSAVTCASDVRQCGAGARSMEEVAQRIVRYLCATLTDPASGQPACVLVRLFKTHPCGALPPDLRARAARSCGADSLAPDARCLTLLATAGDLPEWNDRRASAGHQAIPLLGEEMIQKSPMLLQLLTEFGLSPREVVEGTPRLELQLPEGSYGVFHVEEALGSPHIPAQRDFVIPHGVQSVVGCGGPLSNHDVFALIFFTRIPVSQETARRFRSVALSAKLALLSVLDRPLFIDSEEPPIAGLG